MQIFCITRRQTPDAKPLTPNPRRQTPDAKPPTPNSRRQTPDAKPPTPNPNASQWNIGGVGSQREILALAMYISFFLCRFHSRWVANAKPISSGIWALNQGLIPSVGVDILGLKTPSPIKGGPKLYKEGRKYCVCRMQMWCVSVFANTEMHFIHVLVPPPFLKSCILP